MRRAGLAVAGGLAIVAAAAWALAARDGYGRASVFAPDGAALTVEVASTPRLRALGLGNRDALAADAGMLFAFDEPGTYGFWMKDMRFPIDMIWLRDGEVVGVDADVPVGSEADLPVYRPDVPVDRVLETNAGFAKAHEITVGGRLDIREANR